MIISHIKKPMIFKFYAKPYFRGQEKYKTNESAYTKMLKFTSVCLVYLNIYN